MEKKDGYRGHFSIVRYVPDEFRAEGVNLGVVLLCPELKTLKWKLATSHQRVRRFFGGEQVDITRLKVMKAGLVERLEENYGRLFDPSQMNEFARLFRNQLQLTDLRSITVKDPLYDLDRLYSRLVEERHEAEVSKAKSSDSLTQAQVRALVKSSLERHNLYPRMDHEIELPARYRPEPYIFSHAYQNGRYHVLEEASFALENSKDNNERALILATEIDDARMTSANQRGPIDFTVVASFSPNQLPTRRAIETLFADKNIRLRTAEEVDDVSEEIAKELH